MTAAEPDRIVVRPIALRDIEGFAACVAAVIAEREWLAYVEPFPLPETARFVAKNVQSGTQFVAELDGRIVGWCDVVRSAAPVFGHRGTLGMGLLPEVRGRGLGLRLIHATLDAARAAGIEQVTLHAFARNARALALYRKAGFREVGRQVRAKKLDGHYDDNVIMDIELSGA